jgi:hypothetical protein
MYGFEIVPEHCWRFAGKPQEYCHMRKAPVVAEFIRIVSRFRVRMQPGRPFPDTINTTPPGFLVQKITNRGNKKNHLCKYFRPCKTMYSQTI